MKVALIRAPQVQSHVRGVGFYADRLLSHLNTIDGVVAKLLPFSRNPISYLSYDIVHYSYFDLTFPTYLPTLGKPTVVTLHDVVPLRFPGAFPLGKRGRVVWPVQRLLLRTASAVITDSKTSQVDIAELAGVPRNKIYPIYLAADPAYKPVTSEIVKQQIRRKYHLGQNFVLYVGGVNWNKNLPTLAKACELGRLELVIVGKEALGESLDPAHHESQPFREFMTVATRYPQIKRVGFVPLEELAALYSLAMVYVQPSFYEGFGLPVLEAMSCGCIVMSGKNSSLAEIGGEATLYSDIDSPENLQKKIEFVKTLSPKDRALLSAKSRARAAEFTWEKTAKETYEIYKKVLA